MLTWSDPLTWYPYVGSNSDFCATNKTLSRVWIWHFDNSNFQKKWLANPIEFLYFTYYNQCIMCMHIYYLF